MVLNSAYTTYIKPYFKVTFCGLNFEFQFTIALQRGCSLNYAIWPANRKSVVDHDKICCHEILGTSVINFSRLENLALQGYTLTQSITLEFYACVQYIYIYDLIHIQNMNTLPPPVPSNNDPYKLQS